MIDTIHEARKIKLLIDSLDSRRNALCAPDLTDQQLIPRLYRWFNEIEDERNCPPLADSVTQRKKFCFIIVRLYSPATILFGEQMTEGLRIALARLFGIKSRTSISDYCADMVFLYKNYKDTREVIDNLHRELKKRLHEPSDAPSK